MSRQYVVSQRPVHGRSQYRTTHIVIKALEYLPNAYWTICSTTKRGVLVDGPTPEHPICPRCSDMTTAGTVWRSRDLERE